jgi:hypothetical protein
LAKIDKVKNIQDLQKLIEMEPIGGIGFWSGVGADDKNSAKTH